MTVCVRVAYVAEFPSARLMALGELHAEEVREVRHADLRREEVPERARHRQPGELRPAEWARVQSLLAEIMMLPTGFGRSS